jgi:lysophospholipid acyltransferase (LPLAT)-like uncharacterized protein
LGVVKLAAASGRPIFPVAVVTSRYKELNSWDRCVINLPFGRGAIVWEGPIKVPADADDAMLEALRQEVEAAINRVTERAYALVARSDRVPAHEAHAK